MRETHDNWRWLGHVFAIAIPGCWAVPTDGRTHRSSPHI